MRKPVQKLSLSGAVALAIASAAFTGPQVQTPIITPPGGTIHFVVASDEQHCTITCSDNGPGIPAEDIPHIFDRFYRVDKSRSRRRGQEGLGSGAGLGLSIVKALVERNHGKITVRSEIGNGTSFTVYLPIASPQPGDSAPNLEQSTETPAISP